MLFVFDFSRREVAVNEQMGAICRRLLLKLLQCQRPDEPKMGGHFFFHCGLRQLEFLVGANLFVYLLGGCYSHEVEAPPRSCPLLSSVAND